jgi:glycosyltransferase involved in cell wall biosynthesis
MRVAIHHTGWHVCGGGELYLGALAEELAKEHQVTLLVTSPFAPDRLRELLGLRLENVRLVDLAPGPRRGGRGEHYRAERAVACALSDFDVGIRVATARVPAAGARRNLLHVQAPFSPRRSPRNLWRRMRNREALRGYERVLFNSRFTEAMVRRVAPVIPEPTILYPPVEHEKAAPLPWALRDPVILAVGRFTDRGHPKRQLELVAAFRRLIEEGLHGYRLVLAGGVGCDEASRCYLRAVKAASEGLPVEVRADLPRPDLLELYRRSRIFWHAAGLRLDEWKSPERVEHFGITTVEAMGRGCVALAVDRGGQREIVRHGETGFLWSTEAELIALTWRVLRSSQNDGLIARAAGVARSFSRERFAREALALVAPRS